MSDCCGTEAKKKHGPHFDPILHGSLAVIALTLILSFAHAPIPNLDHFAHTIIDFLKTMWWGILMGMVFVGVMNKIPREYFNHLLGKGDKFPDILKAAAAGVLGPTCCAVCRGACAVLRYSNTPPTCSEPNIENSAWLASAGFTQRQPSSVRQQRKASATRRWRLDVKYISTLRQKITSTALVLLCSEGNASSARLR